MRDLRDRRNQVEPALFKVRFYMNTTQWAHHCRSLVQGAMPGQAAEIRESRQAASTRPR